MPPRKRAYNEFQKDRKYLCHAIEANLEPTPGLGEACYHLKITLAARAIEGDGLIGDSQQASVYTPLDSGLNHLDGTCTFVHKLGIYFSLGGATDIEQGNFVACEFTAPVPIFGFQSIKTWEGVDGSKYREVEQPRPGHGRGFPGLQLEEKSRRAWFSESPGNVANFSKHRVPFAMLQCLALRGHVCTYDEIAEFLRVKAGKPDTVGAVTVQKHAQTVRSLIEPIGLVVESIARSGYRLVRKP